MLRERTRSSMDHVPTPERPRPRTQKHALAHTDAHTHTHARTHTHSLCAVSEAGCEPRKLAGDRWPSAIAGQARTRSRMGGKEGGKGPYINRITIAGLTPVTVTLTVDGQARTRSRMRAWWWGGRKGGAYKAREGYWEYVTRILGRIRVPVTRILGRIRVAVTRILGA